ncbi:uncharacterized protein KGF55_003646 [Candida pseudojiufengensis]|uniref:uncharacterized protein n=1 Tax=Candida pseudojiufengensis TaxID=497109 RepID=UPI0022241B50|nr:uncharacterized protein KGF55_003646 [Candida pseudojiufengensis]KAI5962570.1 hypothetical protein KGF55_003646 [Candida pseudojiufengensis]
MSQQGLYPYKRLGRRRSTVLTITTSSNFTDEFQDQRQLIDYSNNRIFKTLITIQLPKSEILLYTSNIVENEMNPQFQIQLPFIPPYVYKFVLKLWFYSNISSWNILCQYKINLNVAQPFNQFKDDDSMDHFEDNSICLELNDKWFTFENMVIPNSRSSILQSIPHTHYLKPVPSYTFDQMRSINNLYKSIKELNSSKYKLKKQISKYLRDVDDCNVNTLPILINQLKIKCAKLDKDLELINFKIESLNVKLHQVKQEYNDNKKLILDFENVRDMVNDKIEIFNHELETMKNNKDLMKEEIRLLLKKDIMVINEIFPITDSSFVESSVSSDFDILGFQFPPNYKDLKDICYYNSKTLSNIYYKHDFNNDIQQLHQFNILQINTCVAFITHIIQVISRITLTPLTYKMEYSNYKYYIIDHKSSSYPILGKTSDSNIHKFSLYYSQKDENNEKIQVDSSKYIIMNQEFEYGLKLLNTNLKDLINHTREDIYDVSSQELNNVPVDCQDNLLWNLKYLELLITA